VAQRAPMKRADSRPFHGILKGLGVAVIDRLAFILKDATALWRKPFPIGPSRAQGTSPLLLLLTTCWLPL
jgi:hypothetical protein